MAESTAPAACTDAEWQAAAEAGLPFETPGTNAFDAALHKYTERMQQIAYADGRKDERESLTNDKLWLWKNFVDGKPEYWAFDNPYPVNLTDGDSQTLGEPCGYAIFKPSRQGRTDVSEEQVLRKVVQVNAPAPAIQRLMKFYGVDTLEALAHQQAHHVEKLQAKLPPTPPLASQRVREG